jgi:hypothetical protein
MTEPNRDGDQTADPQVARDQTDEPSGEEHQAGTPDDGLPEHLKGKTVQDLWEMLQQKDRYIGERDYLLGQARTQLDNYNRYFQEQQRMAQQPPSPQGSADFSADEIDDEYQTVGATVRKIAAEEIDKKTQPIIQEFQKAQWKEKLERARWFFERGRERAYASNPKLFEGVEGDVEKTLFNGIITGQIKHYETLADPETWEEMATVARSLRARKDPKQFEYIKPRQRRPVAPMATEVPQGTGVEVAGTGSVFQIDTSDPWQKEMYDAFKKMGLNDKEIRQQIQQTIRGGE